MVIVLGKIICRKKKEEIIKKMKMKKKIKE